MNPARSSFVLQLAVDHHDRLGGFDSIPVQENETPTHPLPPFSLNSKIKATEVVSVPSKPTGCGSSPEIRLHPRVVG
jgi:hypothetical protein